MPFTVRFQETPNPNAVKCLLDRRAIDGSRSYADAPSAREDPIASRLFEIAGVRNVLIHTDWITVGKTAESEWGPIRREIRRVLGEVE
jgi:NFU1 iron-sulfur cluster scaffold homolog, mitochondrial